MALAFEYAKAVVEGWLHSPPEMISPEMGRNSSQECFPPIIINVTDALFTGGNSRTGVAAAIQGNGTEMANA